jgi:cell division protein ZapA
VVKERKHVVKVTILGEEFTIRSESAPEHTRAVGEYVDAAIREILASGSVVDTRRAAVQAALRIANELFRARQSAQTLDESMRALNDDMRRWLPPAKREVAP